MRAQHFDFISSSFQRVMLEALIDPSLVWFPSPDGSAITRGGLTGGVTQIIFHGSNLAVAGDGSVSGNIRGFDMSNLGDVSADVTGINMNVDLAQLAAAADAVANGFRSPEYLDYLDVLAAPTNRNIGTSGRDVLESGPGHDILRGRGGNDVLIFNLDGPAAAGANPDDVLPDIFRGGGGHRDLLIIEQYDVTAADRVSVNLSSGTLNYYPNGDVQAIALAELHSIENVRGSSANEQMVGSDDNNWLWGGGGDDKLSGGIGDDHLFGGTGKDRLFGGVGADTLSGGPGRDLLNGGPGSDELTGGGGPDIFEFRAELLFVAYQGSDTITDFDADEDKIRLDGGNSDGVLVSTSNGNTVIDYGNGTITLQGVELNFDDIMFLY